MFRLKIVLTFIVSVLLLTLVGYASHQALLADAIQEDAEESLRRAAVVVEQERRLTEATMLDKARYVASGKDLFDAINKSYAAPAPANEGTEDAPAPEVDPKAQDYERHLKVHERLLRYEKEFELYNTGQGKGVADRDLPLLYLRPTTPDLFFAVDANGKGLAALGKDLFKWFGEDVAKDYPELSKTLTDRQARTALWQFSFDASVKPENRPLYAVAIVPIQPGRDDAPAGAMIVGSLVSDGAAERARALVAGTQGLDPAAAKRILETAPDVVYYFDGKVVGSTLDTNMQKTVAQELFTTQNILTQEDAEKETDFEVDDQTWLARVHPIPGAMINKDKAGLLLLSNLSVAKKPLRDPGTYTMVTGVMLALLGSIVLLLFIQLFLKPLAKLEGGIQEILAGNKDYVFEYNGGNKVAASFSHSLNLMSAYLQGKPMPDDDEAGGAWGDIGQSTGGGDPKTGASQVQGVNMADLMGARPAAKDDEDA